MGQTVSLLQLATITLHSGKKSGYKIECDALTQTDIEAAASMLALILPPFSMALGVPRGGVRIADALDNFASDHQAPVCIVDDVLTTGGSMVAFRDQRPNTGRGAIGAVIFARGPCPDWVTPLFTLDEGLWSA